MKKTRKFYKIQREVGDMRETRSKRIEENVISRLRLEHTGLNDTLFKIKNVIQVNMSSVGKKKQENAS